MKSIIKKSTFKAIYRLLDQVSPIKGDCGLLCDCACCNCEDSSTVPDGTDFDMGIYLLPGEEKLFTRKEDWLKWSVEDAEDYDLPDNWMGKIYFVRCKTPPHCPREKRPLQCRFYPLSPYLNEEGVLHLIYSVSEALPYECPLIKDKTPLEERFIKASYTVWSHLIRDPYILALVDMDSQNIRSLHTPVTIVR